MQALILLLALNSGLGIEGGYCDPDYQSCPADCQLPASDLSPDACYQLVAWSCVD